MQKQHKLDLHILRGEWERPEWTAQCLQSLENLPVNCHSVDGIVDNIFKSRILGYSQGTAEFVTFIDPDDYIDGDPYTPCIEFLESNPGIGGVYTNSTVLCRGKTYPLYSHDEWTMDFHRTHFLPVHQAAVIRRDTINQALKYLRWLIGNSDSHLPTQDQLIYASVAKIAKWYYLPNINGYVWRRHRNGAHMKLNHSGRAYAKQLIATMLG